MDPLSPEKLEKNMAVVACYSVQRVLDNETVHPITSTICFRIHRLLVIGDGREGFYSHPLVYRPEVGVLNEPEPLDLTPINAVMILENL